MNEVAHNDVLTVQGAAALLNVSRSTIYAAAKAGKLPGQKVSQQWRFSRKALFMWMEHACGKPSLQMALRNGSGAVAQPVTMMDVKMAAVYFSVPVSTIYKAVQVGQIPGRKVAGQWRFSLIAIGRWMCHPWKFPVDAAYALDDHIFHDEILKISQVAAFLRVSDGTLYHAARDEKIPCRKVGRQWRFSRLALNLWLWGCLMHGGGLA